MMNKVILSLFLYILNDLSHGSSVLAENADQYCRCRPSEPCWPSQEEWNFLNETVHGRLFIPTSPVEPCLGSEIDEEACHLALEDFGKDPFLLQTSAGATESTGMLVFRIFSISYNLICYCNCNRS